MKQDIEIRKIVIAWKALRCPGMGEMAINENLYTGETVGEVEYVQTAKYADQTARLIDPSKSWDWIPDLVDGNPYAKAIRDFDESTKERPMKGRRVWRTAILRGREPLRGDSCNPSKLEA